MTLIATVPLVTSRIGYAATFSQSLGEIGFSADELLWSATFGIAFVLWAAAISALIVEPLLRPSKAKQILIRNGCGFAILMTLSIALTNGTYTRGDAATYTSWSAAAFLFSCVIASISMTGYEVNSTFVHLRRDRKVAAIAVVLLAPAIFYVAHRSMSPSWPTTLVACLGLAFLLLVVSNWQVSALIMSAADFLRSERKSSLQLIFVSALLALLVISLASVIVASLPQDAEDPNLWSVLFAEAVIGAAVVVQLPTVKLFLTQLRDGLAVVSAALLALSALVVGSGFYYWGAAIAEAQQVQKAPKEAPLLGLERPWACAIGNVAGLPDEEVLVLSGAGTSILLWWPDHGTLRVPASRVTLRYLDSVDSSCS